MPRLPFLVVHLTHVHLAQVYLTQPTVARAPNRAMLLGGPMHSCLGREAVRVGGAVRCTACWQTSQIGKEQCAPVVYVCKGGGLRGRVGGADVYVCMCVRACVP